MVFCLGLFAACLPMTLLAGPPPPNRVAFVTSERGPADFSAWPQAADGLTGLEAADSVCRQYANNAGLDNPDNFVAWLSDSNDDAYCRLAGFSGKKASNCGQVSLPAGAGPWVRTDGKPFAGTLAQFSTFDGLVYTPLRLDENGNQSAIGETVWTATTSYGQLSSNHCTNWTGVNDGFVGTGSLHSTLNAWTQTGGITNNCAADMHLYCFETGIGGPLVLPEERLTDIAFVSSESGTPDFSTWDSADADTTGIEAADSICNNLADAANLPFVGQYKAWLSDATTEAKDRFTSTGAWSRLDNFEVANSPDQLTSGRLETSINVDENGNRQNSYYTWTGTVGNGTAQGDFHCDSWTTTTGQAILGFANRTSSAWTYGVVVGCDFDELQIFCLSDADPENVFEDGFETDVLLNMPP